MKRLPGFPAEPSRTSRYLEELPALYAEGTEGGLLGRFLLACEQVLTGLGDPGFPGLEEVLDGIPAPRQGALLAGLHRYFDPGPDKPETQRAPAEFLEWLAGWVALTLRADWSEPVRRRILSGIVGTYRLRGTPAGLQQVVKAFTGLEPRIQEFLDPFQLGTTSVVGKSTLLGGGPPHYFVVEAFLPSSQAADLARQEEILRAAIDAGKPAHTFYDLRIQIPTMQLGAHSTVGVDTVLGTADAGGPAPG